MIRRLFRFAFLAGLVAAGVAAAKALTRKDDPLPAPATPTGGPWPPLRNETAPTPSAAPAPAPAPAPAETPAETPPEPAPAAEPVVVPEPNGVPVADAPAAVGAVWVAPTGDGECPDGFPVKAKMGSKIFHSPGQLNYDRTTPDRCYVDAAAAEADGLRAAKR